MVMKSRRETKEPRATLAPKKASKISPKEKPTEANYPIHLRGKINWVCESGDIILDVPIKMAILRSEKEIALDCESGGFDYNIILARKGPQYEGRFNGDSWQGKNRLSPVVAFGKLYSNDAGFVLHGTWREDDYEFHWWAELSPAQQETPR